MKKIIALLLCLSMSAAVLCSCADDTKFSDGDTLSKKYTRSTNPTDTFNYNDGVTTPPTVYNTYASQITDFELKLFRNYRKLNKSQSGTFALSPINTALQLGLMANGASADTQEEIISVFGNDLTVDGINSCSSYFLSRIEAVSQKSDSETNELNGKTTKKTTNDYVKLQNSLCVNDISDIKTTFLQTNSNYFGTDIYRFLFKDQNSVAKLNNSFSEYTDKSAINKLDSSNSLVSVSGADICDTWLNAYAKTEVTKGTFKASSGDKSVNFMTSNENYIKSDLAQGIIKYTNSTPLKFIAVMPNEGISIDDYISDFNNLEYSNLLNGMDLKTKVCAKIPEFSVNSLSESRDLTPALTKSGLYTLFTKDATFSNMTHTDKFMFNKMYEIQSKITVNAAGIGGQKTNGTSAALDKRTASLAKTDKTIEFNRPFIFLIIDNESSIPLYVGVVNY